MGMFDQYEILMYTIINIYNYEIAVMSILKDVIIDELKI